METNLEKLIKKCGSKEEAAKKLMVTVRYIDMILAGRKPSKRLQKLIELYLATA